MTLLETERLARKISELLQHSGGAELAPKLAGDYSAACHAANLRLQQCEAMILAGDQQQAIQLAETAPNLLDLVSALEFREADAWRAYCQQNALPLADRIDVRAVRTLNDCYSRGIATDHPLYAAYRRAALGRNDEEALKILRSIARLNPGDANAASELSRLDAKVLTARLQHLAGSVEGSDARLVAAEVETIESFGFKNSPDGDTWRKAQIIRCAVLLEEIAALKNSSLWPDALGKIDFIHGLQREFKLQLPAAAQAQLDHLETWANGEKEKDRRQREFQSLLGELRARIHQSEEKDTSARYVKLPELRDDYEALHKVWRSLSDFSWPIPEDAAAAFKKRSSLLEMEIFRRTAIQRRTIIAISAAVIIIALAAVWLITAQAKIHSFNRQLQAAVSQRQVHAAEQLLQSAQSKKIGNASSIAAAQTFVTREDTLLANYQSAFKQLPAQFPASPNAAQLTVIAGQLTAARDALNALAPDLKSENEPPLQAFEKNWQDYLAQSGATINSLLEQWVTNAEKLANALDYTAPLDQTRKQLAQIHDLIQQGDDCLAGFHKNLQLRSDLLERLSALRLKYLAYANELQKIDNGLAEIEKANSLDEFSTGLVRISRSEFSAAPVVVTASATYSLDISGESTLRSLLNLTNAGDWAYIQKQSSAHFIPSTVMPAERQVLRNLHDDPPVGASHQHYRLWLGYGGNYTIDWITAGMLDDSTGWKTIPAWTYTTNADSANFTPHDYGYFDGQCKLSPTQPVSRVELLNVLQETAAYHSSGLDTILFSDTSYGQSLLAVLDSLKDSATGSPLFRAYLFSHLVTLMQLRPDAWGLSFSPSVVADNNQIKAIVGGDVSDGDWFVSSKVSAYSAPLEQFFAARKSVSYEKQATSLCSLFQAMSKSGLKYAGYVGMDGKPVFVEKTIPAEFIGYSASQKTPVISSAGDKLIALMPLSPVFTLTGSRTELLANAGIDPNNPSFRNALPPLLHPSTSAKP